jgi:hypothetical protein
MLLEVMFRHLIVLCIPPVMTEPGFHRKVLKVPKCMINLKLSNIGVGDSLALKLSSIGL